MENPSDKHSATNNHAVFAICNGNSITYWRFWQHVDFLSKLLPRQSYFVNYCEDRYLFCVALFSAAINSATTLLPPSKSTGIVDELEADYGSITVICDQQLEDITVEQFVISMERLEQADLTSEPCEYPDLAFDRLQPMLIAFTSGSTGRPKPQPKQWWNLVDCAQLAIQQLELDTQQVVMLSTTPPQHMFGLETSVIWPYVTGLVLTNQRPFYPEDIRREIQSMPYPVILCSTPTHLRACVRSAGEWSNLAAVISSTAPLSNELARQIEKIMAVRLYELYGSTETLSFACRRPARKSVWTPYTGVALDSQPGQIQVAASFLPQPVTLDDVFKLFPDGRFEITGRSTDLVKIGGKRASLAELNHRLQSIPAVKDGCFFRIERANAELRLGMIVVSTLKPETILAQLKQHVDEVFLPRTVYYTQAIPRNRVGKILDAELKRLIELLQETGKDYPNC